MIGRHLRKTISAVVLGAAMTLLAGPTSAGDLGIEGTVYEPIEEDFRIMLMRLLARQDWTASIDDLKESARNYTKNLPAYSLPRATETKTRWKDVGVVVSEDIYLPWVDWDTGSVFEPTQKLAVPAGSYLNPIAQMPSRAIERLFVFDATDPEQLAFAKELMKLNIPQLSFMLIAGDLGELSEEMNRPIYHPAPQMLEKFYIEAVPSLIGFGKGTHQGHMAITEFKLPSDAKTVTNAWFGLPYSGYAPSAIPDELELKAATPAAETNQPAEATK